MGEVSAGAGGVNLSQLPGNVYLLTLAGPGEHRFNQTSLAAINRALDEVERDTDAAALVITNEGKFFSNGLDLAQIMKDPSVFELVDAGFHKLLKRALLFAMPTIAAIREVDIKIPLTPGMNSVIQSKIHGHAFYKAVLGGYRFTARTAVEHGFVDAALPDSDSTLKAALKQATALAARKFDRDTYSALKMEMFKTQVRELDIGGIGKIPVTDLVAKL